MAENYAWGSRIRQLRLSKNLTEEEVAEKAGMKRSHLNAIERGLIQDPKSDVIQKLSKGLGIPTDQLWMTALGINLPNSVPVFEKFPYKAGNEPMTSINLPSITSKNAKGFAVQGDHLSPTLHDGDIVVVDDTATLNAGDLVVCLKDEKMQLAKLKKIADELWLEGKGFKIRYQDSQYVFKVISLNIIKQFHDITLIGVAGLIGIAGLLAGVVQSIT